MQIRSFLLGDCAHYESPYIIGVKQACEHLGISHRQVSIRQPIDVITRKLEEQKVDILWTHMLLWAPHGSPPVGDLIALMERVARRGTQIVLHDGDYKEKTRFPKNIASWCSVALCNHEFNRSAWRIPIIKWPYFAFAQDRIAAPDPRWACELWFAGQMNAGPVYAQRTKFLTELQRHVKLRLPTDKDGNTLSKTDVISVSADAVLGFGRPGVKGWVDTRVFQYPGAGAVLVHDDVGGYLEPWVHYVPYQSGRPESVVEALGEIQSMSVSEQQALRQRAFAYVQEHHSSIARVREVIEFLQLGRTKTLVRSGAA